MQRYGYFDDDRREYVITRPDTPVPWINYLGTDGYYGIISNGPRRLWVPPHHVDGVADRGAHLSPTPATAPIRVAGVADRFRFGSMA